METIRILSLPEIAFAHEYGDTIYRNDLPAKTNCIEVTYIAEGTLTLSRDNTESTARRNYVLCNLSRAPLRVTGDTPHKHRTVCFFVWFADAEKDENGALCLPLVTEAAKTGKIRALIDEIIRTSTARASAFCRGCFCRFWERSTLARCGADAAPLTAICAMWSARKSMCSKICINPSGNAKPRNFSAFHPNIFARYSKIRRASRFRNS